MQKRAERAWILYDVANSAFVLVVVTAVLPIFFKQYAAADFDTTASTSAWAFANAAAALIVALLAPLLGAAADYGNRKKRFFLVFFLIGVAATFLLATVREGDWLRCLILFVGARTGFAGANVFYDAFLPDITEPENMDRLSSRGYAWGYIGSVIPFLVVCALLYTGLRQSQQFPALHAKIGFVVIGCWWFLLALPFILHVQPRHGLPATGSLVRDAIGSLGQTTRELRRHKMIVLFLAAYFCYIDGINTIITMASAYGIDIGLDLGSLILVMLMIQLVAFPCTIVYGRLADRFSARSMLLFGIGLFAAITVLAFFLPTLPSPAAIKGAFWILALLVASSMGGVQALSRSVYGCLIPPEHSAAFFGLYAICDKFAAIAGPLLVGLVGGLCGDSRYGVLAILPLLLAGGFLLAKNPVLRQR